MGTEKPLETPVSVCIYLRMPIPASASKKKRSEYLNGEHIKKPDADNCAKQILDAMNGIVYKDDAQIVSLHIRKVYAETPAIEVLVSEYL